MAQKYGVPRTVILERIQIKPMYGVDDLPSPEAVLRAAALLDQIKRDGLQAGAKARLRQQVRDRLNAISPEQREAASLQICARLPQQTVWKSAGSILFFAPLPSEPDVWPLLEEALLAGKTIALPRFSSQTQSYHACVVQNPQADLQRGQFGIREPGVSCAEFPLNRLDLVMVPGVAFQPDGCRLGRGKGFYDRLLAAVRGTKCGVAFDEQIVDAIPAGPLDIRMDCVLTPTRWIET